MAARSAWGIDLGHSAVKGVWLRISDGLPRVVRADAVPLRGSPPTDAEELSRDPRLLLALAELRRRHPLKNARVCISIPSRNILLRRFEVPPCPDEQLHQVARQKALERVPLASEDVVWDYALFPECRAEGGRSGVAIAASRRTVESYIALAMEAGIGRIEAVTAAPLALLNLARLAGGQAPCFLVDVGYAVTQLVAVGAGRFFFTVLPVGGRTISAGLSEQLGVPLDQAELAKLEGPEPEDRERFSAAARPAVARVARQVRAAAASLRRAGMEPPETCYLFGGGARLPELARRLPEALGCRRSGLSELGQKLQAAPRYAAAVGAEFDRFAVATGAAMELAGTSASGLSLSPPEVLPAARARATRSVALAVGIALWALLGTLWLFGLKTSRVAAEPLRQYRQLSAVLAARSHRLSAASDREHVEGPLRDLLSLGTGRVQALQAMNAVASAFASANRASAVKFQMLSFGCKRTSQEPEAPPGGWLVGQIKGRISTGRTGAAGEAEKAFRAELLSRLRALPELTRLTGTAAFRHDRALVTATWPLPAGLVREGDLICGPSPEQTYRVREILSPTELLLTRPYAGADAVGEYRIPGVSVASLDPRTHTFVLTFQVPARPALSLEQVIGKQEEQEAASWP